MTSSEKAAVFRLLDSYARNKHRCFVAEFDLAKAGTYFSVCFRPTGGTKDSPRPYAYRYLQIGAREAIEAVERNELPASIIEQLDKELPSVPQD
jgi:hypothetical protein